MTPTDTHTLADSHTGLNDAAQSGQLVLRVRGSSHDGQVVHLQSPKCTIGSDRRCTLRLDLPGVHPVHCLIVRGHRTTVVRRWSPDTRLNDSAFTDAELNPGDRLGIGPIEMEVLKSNPLPSLPQSPKSVGVEKSPEFDKVTQRLNLANRQGRHRARLLAAQLRDARAEIERIKNQAQQTPVPSEHGSDEQDIERERLRSEVEQIETQKAALELRQAEWDQQHQEQEQTLAERMAQLDSREAAAVTQEHELNERQRQLESQRAIVEENHRHVDLRETELDEDRHQIETSQAELDAKKTQFEQKQQEWENQQTALEQTRQELDSRREFLEETSHQIEAAQKELLLQRDAFEHERSETVTQTADAQAQTTETAEPSAEAKAQWKQLQNDQAAFDEEKRQWEDEVQNQQRQWELQQEDLENQRKRFNAKHSEVKARLTNWQHELDMREAELEKLREVLDTHQPDWRDGLSKKSSGMAQEDASVNVTSEFAKVVMPLPSSMDEAHTEEATPLSHPETTVESSSVDTHPLPLEMAAEPSEETALEEESKEPGEGPHPTMVNEDDDSIDEYMAQLMQRLNAMTGGDTSQTNASTKTKPATVSRQATLAATHPYRQKKEEEAADEEEAKNVAAKRAAKPRRSALEGISLAAMRELAKATASSAISTHTQSQMKKTIRGKLSLSVAALTLGASLILGWLFWGFESWQFYVGVAGIFLALLWVVQYFILAGRLTLGGTVGVKWNAKKEEEKEEKEDNQ